MRLLFFLPFIVLLASCKKEDVFKPYETLKVPVPVNVCPNYSLEPATITENDEYLILEAIYNTYYAQCGFLQIKQWSTVAPPEGYIHAFLPSNHVSLDSTAIENYILKNQVNQFWGEQFHQSVNLISRDEVDCFFATGVNGWENYYSAFPNSKGFLDFTRPEITSANEAVIEYGHSYGMLGCEDYVVILEKTSTGWIVKERKLIGMC